MQLTNTYLYNTDSVPAFDPFVIMRRIELLKENLEELLNHSYYTRDARRVADVLKAIKFYERMQDQ